MVINIYTKFNGVGLEADARILKAILDKDHDVAIIDWEKPSQRRQAYVGIHLEHIRSELLNLCKVNIAIPNTEWFDEPWKIHLRRIDAVWCKSHYTFEIFSKLHPNCIYTSWTSEDKYLPVDKRKMFIHMAGRSSHKGSDVILQLWKNRPEMPLLLMQKIEHMNGYRLMQRNYIGQFTRVPDNRDMMNTALFHLCPSKAEGFGHYINEAMSCGGIVITTDAPPMNELVPSDCGFTVKASPCGRHRLSTEFCVDKSALLETLMNAYHTDNDTLIQMSQRSREVYLQRDADFKSLALNLINNV